MLNRPVIPLRAKRKVIERNQASINFKSTRDAMHFSFFKIRTITWILICTIVDTSHFPLGQKESINLDFCKGQEIGVLFVCVTSSGFSRN